MRRLSYLRVREGKSKSARRVTSLTDRASQILKARLAHQNSSFVFANREGKRYVSTSINHLHRKAFVPEVGGKRR